MRSREDYRSAFELSLGSLPIIKEGLEGLYEPIVYGLSGGGKRLRPLLALMGCEAVGGDMEQALPAAMGLEMFHNFTLLHDDVMDKSDMRRGRPTVHKQWDENRAILSGDTMTTLAYELMMQVEDPLLRRVLERYSRMTIAVYEGQQLDMEFETAERVSVERYLEMISLKTGALLGTSAAIGALIGGGSEKCVNYLDEYGVSLGVAFQIQDDYLDVFGDAATFGKPIGGDILNGKKTFLLCEGLSREDAYSQALAEAMTLPAGELKITTVRNLYKRMGLEESCRKSIMHWTGRALGALKKSGVNEEGYEAFSALADKLIERKK